MSYRNIYFYIMNNSEFEKNFQNMDLEALGDCTNSDFQVVILSFKKQ